MPNSRPTCGTCAAFDAGACRFGPPTAFPVGGRPGALAGQAPQIITAAAFPAVNPDRDWCMQHLDTRIMKARQMQNVMELDLKVPGLILGED